MKRGDIYFVSLEPTTGHEQRGHRPVFVLTPERYNRLTKMPLVAPITNGGAFAIRHELAVPLVGIGMQISGVIRCDQIRSIDLEARGARFVESAPQSVIDATVNLVTLIVQQDEKSY